MTCLILANSYASFNAGLTHTFFAEHDASWQPKQVRIPAIKSALVTADPYSGQLQPLAQPSQGTAATPGEGQPVGAASSSAARRGRHRSPSSTTCPGFSSRALGWFRVRAENIWPAFPSLRGSAAVSKDCLQLERWHLCTEIKIKWGKGCSKLATKRHKVSHYNQTRIAGKNKGNIPRKHVMKVNPFQSY